jgi:hypothetical protein
MNASLNKIRPAFEPGSTAAPALTIYFALRSTSLSPEEPGSPTYSALASYLYSFLKLSPEFFSHSTTFPLRTTRTPRSLTLPRQ